MNLAYHYTVGEKLPSILADGALRPTSAHVAPGERPILWFSRNPVWEPTAAKACIVNGRAVPMTFEDHVAIGLVRFSYPAHKLVPWPKIGRRAGTPPLAARGLESVAYRDGARPSDWLGTLKPLRLRDLRCEVWEGGWHEVSAQAALDQWAQEAA